MSVCLVRSSNTSGAFLCYFSVQCFWSGVLFVKWSILLTGFSLLSSANPLEALSMRMPFLRNCWRSHEFLRDSSLIFCVVPIIMWSLMAVSSAMQSSLWHLKLQCWAALYTWLQNVGNDSWASVPKTGTDGFWLCDFPVSEQTFWWEYSEEFCQAIFWSPFVANGIIVLKRWLLIVVCEFPSFNGCFEGCLRRIWILCLIAKLEALYKFVEGS